MSTSRPCSWVSWPGMSPPCSYPMSPMRDPAMALIATIAAAACELADGRAGPPVGRPVADAVVAQRGAEDRPLEDGRAGAARPSWPTRPLARIRACCWKRTTAVRVASSNVPVSARPAPRFSLSSRLQAEDGLAGRPGRERDHEGVPRRCASAAPLADSAFAAWNARTARTRADAEDPATRRGSPRAGGAGAGAPSRQRRDCRRSGAGRRCSGRRPARRRASMQEGSEHRRQEHDAADDTGGTRGHRSQGSPGAAQEAWPDGPSPTSRPEPATSAAVGGSAPGRVQVSAATTTAPRTAARTAAGSPQGGAAGSGWPAARRGTRRRRRPRRRPCRRPGRSGRRPSVVPVGPWIVTGLRPSVRSTTLGPPVVQRCDRRSAARPGRRGAAGRRR